MKHAVGFFLPLCIFSFLAFVISVAVLGVEDTASRTPEAALTSTSTRLYEDYSRIEVSSNFGDVHLFPNDDDSTVIIADEVLVDDVTAYVNDNTLHIFCGNINKDFDFSDLFEDIFTFNSGDVTVYVPEKVYDALYATNNAGSTEILDIAAKIADLDTNAGDLTYAQPDDFRCERLSIQTNAGTSKVFNADTYNYDIGLNAGDIYVYGLTGTGLIDVSAGDCHLNYAALNGDITTDVSAGELNINLPADISAKIIADISAGDVEVDHYNTESDMDDGDVLTIGSGEHKIMANVSAGDINITDDVEYMLPDLPTLPPIFDTTAAVEVAPVATMTTSKEVTRTPDDVVDIDLGALGGVNVGDEHVDVNVGPIGVNVDNDKVKVEIGDLKVDIG